jgi:hypothetical protein
MANFKHKRPRVKGGNRKRDKYRFNREKYKNSWNDPAYSWLKHYPRYHDIVYHNRPRRRHDKATLIKILHGADADNLTWELGNHKPHKYYW